MTPEENLITVGELKAQLEAYEDDTKVFFGCYGLEFFRLKMRGEKLLQVEFNQTVFTDDNGKVCVNNY